MTYAEALKANYRETHRRLWGDEQPPVVKLARPMAYSGPATGGLWNGLNTHEWDRLPTRKGREIIRAVLYVTGVRQVDFMSHRRSYVFVEARQLACWFMRHYTGLSAPQIGRMIGGRDHSTILHAIKRVNAQPDKFSKRLLSIAGALRVSLPEGVPFQ